jgi:hypothetical protein
LRWAIEAFMYTVYTDSPPYAGTEACTPGLPTPIGTPCDPRGFYCPDSPYLCFGRTGGELLDSLSTQFAIFSSETSLPEVLGYILIIGGVFRVGYFLQLRNVPSQAPSPPPKVDGASAEATIDVGPMKKKKDGDESPVPSVHGGNAMGAGSIEFSFTGVNATIPAATFPKKVAANQILKPGSTVVVPSGQTCAILGPSGAGKTTLLNAITLQKSSGVPRGELTLTSRSRSSSFVLSLASPSARRPSTSSSRRRAWSPASTPRRATPSARVSPAASVGVSPLRWQ